MRDRNDNVVIICSIENVDPMGVHTGDSVTVAPAQTLTDPLYQELRDQAIRVIRAVGVETGGSNVQFARQPRDRRDRRDRDEPARLALLGAGLEGDRLPDREDRRQARRRLRARGDPQRHHRGHAGLVRADDRLRRHQDAALRVREVPRRRGRADHPHEVGRRGDGDRPHLPRVVREGDALARARRRRRAARRRRGAARAARDPARRPLRPRARGVPPRASTVEEVHAPHLDRPLVPARAAGAGDRGRRHRGPRPHLPLGRHLRRRVRGAHALLLLGARAQGAAGRRGAARRPRVGRHPRLGPEPDRPGDRVRLLLRARGDDRARVGPRRGDDQLQPGDGLDRLRHLRPPLLRAADRRGRARRDRGRAARGRDRPVRRPDAAAAGEGARGRRRARCSARRSTRSTSPRTAAASAPCCAGSRSPTRPTAPRSRPRRRR